MKFRAVFLDIDDTLFDFQKSSFEALQLAFADIGEPFSEADMPGYEAYNRQLWEAFERGEIEKELIYEERFRLYFAERGIRADTAAFNRRYLAALAEGRNFMPHCEDLLRALHGRWKIFILTNGDGPTQVRRIARSGFAPYFDGVFISEELGCKKPERVFYDRVFAEIGEEYRTCTLMVGDSLSSDMQGGRNAGIPTCFYGPRDKADARCDYVIEDLMELVPIMEQNG